MSLESVRGSYGARADEYVEAVGRIEHVAAPDLALVERWVCHIEGPVLDVGCCHVTHTESRADRPARTHGAILATRA